LSFAQQKINVSLSSAVSSPEATSIRFYYNVLNFIEVNVFPQDLFPGSNPTTSEFTTTTPERYQARACFQNKRFIYFKMH
jgi:hypothetical protein